ncbi:MAG TPA: Ldh family oxidoreductase [Thermoanaerobaculia bacterium]|nr:Ldh family oxidoreductase [Thermoanaerobaculia bacterium]
MTGLRTPEEDSVRVPAERLRRHVAAIFERLGLPEDDASTAAEVLVQADLMGVDSHGVSNYIQLLYEPGLRRGTIEPRPRIEVVAETPISALVDGGGGLGLVVGARAMAIAIEKAGAAGVGLVAVRNSRHYGAAGIYSRMAIERDMIGLSLTNSDQLVAPTFGRESRIGTNPIAVAVPAGVEAPFLLDMATSTVPLGKIMLARRHGVALPEGWAADEQGIPTSDPGTAFRALRLLPLGGTYEQGSHKGYGLGVVVDILSGVLSGAGVAVGQGLGGQVGHFFAALRIDVVRPVESFKAAMDEYLRALRETPPAPGQDRVLYAGLLEHETEGERRRDGIPLHRDVVDFLDRLGAELGVGASLFGAEDGAASESAG